MKPDEEMQVYITRLQGIVRKLRSVGETVNDSFDETHRRKAWKKR